jgi:spore coat protein U-like protein
MVATLFRVPATLVRVVATLFRVAAKLLGVALTLLGVAATLLGVAPAGSALANSAVSCSLAATPLAFGQYVPFSNLPDDFTATITVTCTATGAATVPLQGSMSLIGAMGSSGRQLSNGRATLRYHTYLNPARTMYWGDGTGRGGTQAVTGIVGPGIPFRQSYTVYGRILARQSAVRVGTYADQITVMLNY